MERKYEVLHSEGRHRRYKRKVRKMFLEIVLIIVLIFVAIKFVKDDEEKPTVSRFNAEEQKQIINNEMKESQEQQEDDTQELIIQSENSDIEILKIIFNYQEKDNETIMSLDIKNYMEKTEEKRILLKMLDENENLLAEIYVNIPNLDKNQQTRVNMVLDGDYRQAEKVQIHEEE